MLLIYHDMLVGSVAAFIYGIFYGIHISRHQKFTMRIMTVVITASYAVVIGAIIGLFWPLVFVGVCAYYLLYIFLFMYYGV